MTNPNISTALPVTDERKMRIAVAAVFAGFALIACALLAFLALGATSGYAISCTRADDQCALVQEHVTGDTRFAVPLRVIDSAVVEIQRARRGGARTLLMVRAGRASYFAAEYEGFGKNDAARDAASRFNRFLADSTQARLAIAVRHPLLQGIAWIGAVALLVFIAVGYRMVRRRV